jgi:hypothetical protein
MWCERFFPLPPCAGREIIQPEGEVARPIAQRLNRVSAFMLATQAPWSSNEAPSWCCSTPPLRHLTTLMNPSQFHTHNRALSAMTSTATAAAAVTPGAPSNG